MFTCACCGHSTLKESPGSYQICKVCFWEDDGTKEVDEYSDCNGDYLYNAQQNYKAMGACDSRFIQMVIPWELFNNQEKEG